MIRHGEAPYLECSTRGDIRFSAYWARVQSYGNKTIESIYQGAKVFANGQKNLPIKLAKGRPAINAVACAKLYSELWDAYIHEHPELIEVLRAATGLSDRFGQMGHVCQATELWRIRNDALWAPRFSTQWEQDDYEREKRGEKPLGPRSAP